MNRLVHETCKSRNSVFNAIKQLEARGYVQRQRHAGRAFCNSYLIYWDKLIEAASKWETRATQPLLEDKGTINCTEGVQHDAPSGADSCTETLEETLEIKPSKNGFQKSTKAVALIPNKRPSFHIETVLSDMSICPSNKLKTPSSKDVIHVRDEIERIHGFSEVRSKIRLKNKCQNLMSAFGGRADVLGACL